MACKDLLDLRSNMCCQDSSYGIKIGLSLANKEQQSLYISCLNF